MAYVALSQDQSDFLASLHANAGGNMLSRVGSPNGLIDLAVNNQPQPVLAPAPQLA